ncbi:Hypothetical predicted protein [Paramuricea clavata]|uniref:Uncharacterized protein n=1 Tax=Paramuricea clavata TaxID=317549 RepID=A0A6S7JAN0_PARCT|nr:Hypothetical predicted protein [Paramuricea clavata]
MANSMIRPVSIRAGLGYPPLQFTTNRVECINHLLSDEADGQPQTIDERQLYIQRVFDADISNCEVQQKQCVSTLPPPPVDNLTSNSGLLPIV